MADLQQDDSEPFDNDDKDGFERCYHTLQEPLTTNFMVDFSPIKGRRRTNLDSAMFSARLGAPRAAGSTRWINFWGGHRQPNAIKQVVSRYGLSPRLIHLLYPEHSAANTPKAPFSEETSSEEGSTEGTILQSTITTEDTEKGVNQPAAKITATAPTSSNQKLTFECIVDDLWHFCSIDWGTTMYMWD